MTQSWEDFKKKKQAEFGLQIEVIPQPKIEKPKAEPKEEIKPFVKLFNVHKRSLPVGEPPLDKIVVFGVTKEEAEWWVSYKLKTKCYEDEARQTKTIIYYDVIPVDAQPREKSIYYNERPVFREEQSAGQKYFEDKQPYPDAVSEIDWK